MPWFAPTLDLCRQRIAGPEWDALSEAAADLSQDGDAMARDVIATQVGRIRGRVAARPENMLGPEGTIPDELTGAFQALWVYDFITRLPKMKRLLDELRVKARDAAEGELRDTAKGLIKIVPPEQPAAPALQAGGSGVALVSSTPRRARRDQTNGLF